MLKKIDFFDARLASRRKTLNLEQISLYPKGKYIGFVSEIMEKKLKDLGVKFINSSEVKISRSDDSIKINYDENSTFVDYIFIVTELDNTLTLFNDEIKQKGIITMYLKSYIILLQTNYILNINTFMVTI